LTKLKLNRVQCNTYL